MQRTFPPDTLKRRTRTVARGGKDRPLDLVSGFEEQGYEPEAQVTQKGEISLRGGILDIYRPAHEPVAYPPRIFWGLNLSPCVDSTR